MIGGACKDRGGKTIYTPFRLEILEEKKRFERYILAYE
jgi:hypothetical protein